jgi:simple sugar transport system substrate-binding protein
MDKTWTSAPYASGMEGGYIKLATFGKTVPESVRKEALALKEKIANGQFVIYKGPLKDKEGKTRLAAGEAGSAKWLAEMNFFVDGVEGSLPHNK